MAAAIRLTFCVDEGRPYLMLSQAVDMRAPSARPIESFERTIGIWLETRDGKGTRLFVQLIDSSALRPTVDVHPALAEPALDPVRSPAKRLLHVIVPTGPEVASFHLLLRERVGDEPKELFSGLL